MGRPRNSASDGVQLAPETRVRVAPAAEDPSTRLRTVSAAEDASPPRKPEPVADPAAGIRHDPTVGSILSGRYRLDEMLGAGGMGIVFRAADLKMPGVHVAIKLLRPEVREHPGALNMLRESVRKVRLLPHPNIAAVYSLETDGDRDYVIMELLAGQTLQSLLDGQYARGLPPSLTRTLIRDLCAALAYAHDHGVIHSDIKPSNIFVTPAGRAKLFDFDIARVLRGPLGYFDAGAARAVTLAYASVELEAGGQPDPRDDVYALACVIHEMISGRHPFGGRSAADARGAGARVPRIEQLGRREQQALTAALAFDRDQRLSAVEPIAAAFSGPDFWGSVLRNWWPAAVTAGVVFAAVGAWTLLSKPPPAARQDAAPVAKVSTVQMDKAKAAALSVSALNVDGNDERLRQALRLLGTAPAGETPAMAEERAGRVLGLLRAAVSAAPRVAHLGSSEAQMNQALELCQAAKLRALRCRRSDISDEAPRDVSLRPFAIDAAPVTNGDYESFVRATGRRSAAETDGRLFALDMTRGRDVATAGQSWRSLRDAALKRGESAATAPVAGMDLDSARAFCRWRGQRLPNEDEWEYAARGANGQVFPWGDDPAAAPVYATGSKLAEWVEARVPGQRILRGGSWLLPQPFFQRLPLRRLAAPGAVLDSGFRCAVSVENWPSSPADIDATGLGSAGAARPLGAGGTPPAS